MSNGEIAPFRRPQRATWLLSVAISLDALNRGTYLLSCDQYVARAGRFSGTVACVVSCYAPDYSEHTAAGIVTSVLPLKK